MKRFASILFALLMLLTLVGTASAHVTVWPKVSNANGFERYTIRVPNEKDIPTIKVRVELPAGSTFSSVLPMAGWTFETEKDAAGKVVALVWSGGEIKKGEFMEFGINVRNPAEAGDVAWKAYQTYSDGTVVAWVNVGGDNEPAPMVKLQAAADAGGHGAPATPAPTTTAPTAPAPAAETPAEQAPAAAAGAPVGTWLGGGALLVSLVALGLSLRKR